METGYLTAQTFLGTIL